MRFFGLTLNAFKRLWWLFFICFLSLKQQDIQCVTIFVSNTLIKADALKMGGIKHSTTKPYNY